MIKAVFSYPKEGNRMNDYTATANFKQQSFDELPDEEKEKIITYLRSRLGDNFNEEILRRKLNKSALEKAMP